MDRFAFLIELTSYIHPTGNMLIHLTILAAFEPTSFGIVHYLFSSLATFQHQPAGEPREHHLGEVLQGRTKSKLNIIFSYLSVRFWEFMVP